MLRLKVSDYAHVTPAEVRDLEARMLRGEGVIVPDGVFVVNEDDICWACHRPVDDAVYVAGDDDFYEEELCRSLAGSPPSR